MNANLTLPGYQSAEPVFLTFQATSKRSFGSKWDPLRTDCGSNLQSNECDEVDVGGARKTRRWG
jgi:hypothetical protein